MRPNKRVAVKFRLRVLARGQARFPVLVQARLVAVARLDADAMSLQKRTRAIVTIRAIPMRAIPMPVIRLRPLIRSPRLGPKMILNRAHQDSTAARFRAETRDPNVAVPIAVSIVVLIGVLIGVSIAVLIAVSIGVWSVRDPSGANGPSEVGLVVASEVNATGAIEAGVIRVAVILVDVILAGVTRVPVIRVAVTRVDVILVDVTRVGVTLVDVGALGERLTTTNQLQSWIIRTFSVVNTATTAAIPTTRTIARRAITIVLGRRTNSGAITIGRDHPVRPIVKVAAEFPVRVQAKGQGIRILVAPTRVSSSNAHRVVQPWAEAAPQAGTIRMDVALVQTRRRRVQLSEVVPAALRVVVNRITEDPIRRLGRTIRFCKIKIVSMTPRSNCTKKWACWKCTRTGTASCGNRRTTIPANAPIPLCLGP